MAADPLPGMGVLSHQLRWRRLCSEFHAGRVLCQAPRPFFSMVPSHTSQAALPPGGNGRSRSEEDTSEPTSLTAPAGAKGRSTDPQCAQSYLPLGRPDGHQSSLKHTARQVQNVCSTKFLLHLHSVGTSLYFEGKEWPFRKPHLYPRGNSKAHYT